MRIILSLLLFFLVSVFPLRIHAEWTTVAGNAARTSFADDTLPTNPAVIWYRPIDAYINQNTQIITANNRVYLATARGLYAFDATTGDVSWRYDTELPIGNSPTIATINGTSLAIFGGYDKKLHAVNALTGGSDVWTFTGATAGYDANPLVVNNMVYVGNRDGYFYAVNAATGQLAWQYPPAGQPGIGPIHLSPAYKNGTMYFATDYHYAYALNTNGTLKWKSSQKLPGDGYNSFWPVVYTDPTTNKDYVIFSTSNPYREFGHPGTRSQTCGGGLCDYIEFYWTDLWSGRPNTALLGATATINEPWASGKTIYDYRIMSEYFEEPSATESTNDPTGLNRTTHKPWRRMHVVIDGTNGAQFPFDIDQDGRKEDVPVFPYANGSGSTVPPAIDNNGFLYFSNVTETSGQGRVMGWKFGTPYFVNTSLAGASDEIQMVSIINNFLLRNLCFDRKADVINLANPTGGSTELWGYQYGLTSLAPNYDVKWWCPANCYENLQSGFGGQNSVYSSANDQNPIVPYQNKLFVHRSNAIIAFGTGTRYNNKGLLTAPAKTDPVSPSPDSHYQNRLHEEIAKMMQAGHLRPGYYNDSQFSAAYEFLSDYFINPGDTLYTLAIAYPLITDATLKSQLATYLKTEYNRYFTNGMLSTVGWANGAARESMPMPPEIQAHMNSLGDGFLAQDHLAWHWSYHPFNFYAMWKYAQTLTTSSTNPSRLDIYNHAVTKLQYPADVDDSEFQLNPFKLNAFISGYIGFLELQTLVGRSLSDTAIRTNVTNELNRLKNLRVSQFSKDTAYTTTLFYARRSLNLARNFMWLTPETGTFMRSQLLTQTQAAYNEYNAIGPFWFVSRFNSAIAESGMQNLYDSPALFHANAWIFNKPKEELAKYLDVPAFERGDLFYIQKLVTLITAPSNGTPTATPVISSTQSPPSPTAPAVKAGDANGDNRVDGLDYVIWLNHYGGTNTGVTNGDFNSDNRVDGLDYVIWLNHYGS